MTHPVALVVLDGMKYDTATAHLTFLERLVDAGRGRRWRMECAMPSLSRPLYETLHTGLAPDDHGVTKNDDVRLSTAADNIFSVAREAGRTTAASAFSWMHELYNEAPFDAGRHTHVAAPDRPIQYGWFYEPEEQPDAEVFHHASRLIVERAPDYILVHPMGMDFAGHGHGGRSAEYRDRAIAMNAVLARHLPDWLARGYQVMVTSDHGMDDAGSHGGDTPDERLVPFYWLGSPAGAEQAPRPDETVSQLAVAATVLGAMGLRAPRDARTPPLDGPRRPRAA
ncbi:MAG: alkaline phosphatase family protein [Rhodobacterales bacterium]|nr:alkaline phosphatase family protein [Rhodobacterales bacterium]